MTACGYCERTLNFAYGAPTTAPTLLVCRSCFNVSYLDSNGAEAKTRTLDDLDSVQSLAPDGSVMAEVLRSVPAAIARLPVLPEVPRRVISLAHDPITSMRDMAAVINEDAGFSLRILGQANSAAASPVSPITEVAQACSHLGLKTIVRAAETEMAAALYQHTPPALREQSQRLWRHNVVAAYCADSLGRSAALAEGSSAFLAGLVHDVGKLILMQLVFEEHRGRVGRLSEDPMLLHKVLDQFGPWTGAQVLQYWKLPADVVSSTFYSSRPEIVPNDTWRALAFVVGLGSDMATQLGYGFGGDSADGPRNWAEHPAVSALEIKDEDVDIIGGIVAEMVSQMGELFDIR